MSPVKKPEVVPTTEVNPVKVRMQGLQLLNPLRSALTAVHITNADTYLEADALLGRIRHARAVWASKMDPILQPLQRAKKEIEESMRGAKALHNEVEAPLLQMETGVKAAMRDYKIEEQRRLQAEEQERAREADRLRREAEEKARREQAAKTPQLKARLAQQRVDLETRAQTVEQGVDMNVPVRGGSSAARNIKRPQVTDLPKFLAAIKDYEPKAGIYELGHPPMSLISVEAIQTVLLKLYREQPGAVESWPGIEIVTDIVIAGR